MSDFTYGNEIRKIEAMLAGRREFFERTRKIEDPEKRLQLEPEAEKTETLVDELSLAQRAWDQGLDAALEKATKLKEIARLIETIGENPYTRLHRQAWVLLADIRSELIRARIELAENALRPAAEEEPKQIRVGKKIDAAIREEYGVDPIDFGVDIAGGFVDGEHIGIVSAASTLLSRIAIRKHQESARENTA